MLKLQQQIKKTRVFQETKRENLSIYLLGVPSSFKGDLLEWLDYEILNKPKTKKYENIFNKLCKQLYEDIYINVDYKKSSMLNELWVFMRVP